MVGIAEVLFRFVSRQIEALPPFIIFYPVLVVVCVLCGLAPALLALALCTWVGVSNGVGPLALGSFIFLNLVMFAVLRKLHHLRQSEAMAHSQMQELLDKTQAEREWYSLVLRSLAEEVYFTDVDGRYRYANHAVLNEFGYERVDGVPVTDILARLEVYRADGSPRPIEEAPPLRALKGEVIGDEEQIVRVPRTGEFRYRQVSASPVRDAGGNIIGSVSVVRDITERKRAEEALREADRRKDVFMSTLSHELRNPLAPIRTAAMVMESPQAGPEEIERARRIIVRQVTHMASLLDDLLEVSRYTRGDLVLRKSHVPLQQVLAGAIEVAQPLLQEKGHQLRIDVPDPSPVLEADPLRLTQVVSNLLTNAAKYTNAGGEIILACRADDQGLKLSVQDNGIGLAPESLDRIFEMFVQVESTRTQLQGGLGIGLALVKAIVELHGGRVEAQSEGLSRGSTFTISLPSNLLVRHVGTANKKSPTGHSPVFRILAADDNVDASKSLGMFLELSGNQVTLAHDGLSALRIAEQLRPEVIVLDIGMPGMNGYEVARELRKQPWAKDMFLIALTGWGQESDRAEAIEAGFDIHFTKPVDPSELQAALPRREDKK
ncbi:MAG TPA: ATP-binding protein [Steroidobacteraceae bacterium]|nr:ATP-binding protein [Steroidobacteraceae bacterium]